jgi:gamma-glutamylcyclotransferase
MLYFGYGSNLNWKEMRRKCPHARMVCVATLREHTFNFWVTSRDSVGGEMDIQGKKGQKVWGVVYQIDELEIGRLDQGESFDPGSPHAITSGSSSWSLTKIATSPR